MVRQACAGFAAIGLLTGLLAGCAFDLKNRSSQRITVEPGNVMLDKPAVSPTNDARSWNGEPMDYRWW
jgi:hypothetical protein